MLRVEMVDACVDGWTGYVVVTDQRRRDGDEDGDEDEDERVRIELKKRTKRSSNIEIQYTGKE